MRDDFGSFLQEHIARSGMSRHGFALRAAVDSGYLVKLCHGKRTGPTRGVVSALECALGLRGVERDRFYAAAGYLPPSVEQLGDWNEALTDVAGVLGNDLLSDGDRAEFVMLVQTIARRYQPLRGATARESARRVPVEPVAIIRAPEAPTAPLVHGNGHNGHAAALLQTQPATCGACGGSVLRDAAGDGCCASCGREG